MGHAALTAEGRKTTETESNYAIALKSSTSTKAYFIFTNIPQSKTNHMAR